MAKRSHDSLILVQECRLTFAARPRRIGLTRTGRLIPPKCDHHIRRNELGLTQSVASWVQGTRNRSHGTSRDSVSIAPGPGLEQTVPPIAQDPPDRNTLKHPVSPRVIRVRESLLVEWRAVFLHWKKCSEDQPASGYKGDARWRLAT